MATSKTLTPTNVTIQIPEFTDQPDQRVNSNCLDKLGDAVNVLNSKKTTILNSTNVTSDTSILSLENGAYQVASSGEVAPYLPYKYGTLYVAKSSNNYGMYLFESTVGTYFVRHKANATTWSGDWKRLAVYSSSDNLFDIRTKTETVTTSASGNAGTSLSPASTILFGASDMSNNNNICIPFRASSTVWGINVKSASGSAVASTEITVRLIYANLS